MIAGLLATPILALGISAAVPGTVVLADMKNGKEIFRCCSNGQKKSRPPKGSRDKILT